MLAAEIHQNSTNSSDISFDLELLGMAPPPNVVLKLARTNANLFLSWPAGAGAFVLQAAGTLGNATNWVDASGGVIYLENEFRALVLSSNVQQFFRLRKL